MCCVISTFHPWSPDNVSATGQIRRPGLVRREWLSLSGGTVPGPMGTQQTALGMRAPHPPAPPPRLTIKPCPSTPTSHQMSALLPSLGVQFPVSLNSCCLWTPVKFTPLPLTPPHAGIQQGLLCRKRRFLQSRPGLHVCLQQSAKVNNTEQRHELDAKLVTPELRLYIKENTAFKATQMCHRLSQEFEHF